MITLSCPSRPTLPVGKIVAVGRNYADHAREMGAAAGRDAEPVLFLKPPSALAPGGGVIELPSFSRLVHHEVELVVRIGAHERIERGGRRIPRAHAAQCVDSIAVGLDLTARDRQNDAKRRGDPWSVAKGFDQSAPLSQLAPLDDPSLLDRLELELTVNGALRQRGATAEMTTSVAELVAFVSTRFRLEAGDLLFTGTPAGVGPLVAGDVARATLRESAPNQPTAPIAELEIRCVAPTAS